MTEENISIEEAIKIVVSTIHELEMHNAELVKNTSSINATLKRMEKNLKKVLKND